MINIKKLGIVAGNGDLPISIIKECKNKEIEPFIVSIDGFADKNKYSNLNHISITFGGVGKAISFFKKNDVKYIVLAGGVKKPHLKTIRPDLKGFFLLLKLLKCKFFGDDSILQTVILFLEKQGLQVIPVDKILTDVKIPCGIAGKIDMPSKDYKDDVALGTKVLKQISDLDIGQSVVVQNGIVLGIECIEGTEKLIERCSKLKYTSGRKPILVKIKKIRQTRKADLPTIGCDTIKQVKYAGFAGIAIDHENCLVINRDDTIKLANENNIFIMGIKI